MKLLTPPFMAMMTGLTGVITIATEASAQFHSYGCAEITVTGAGTAAANGVYYWSTAGLPNGGDDKYYYWCKDSSTTCTNGVINQWGAPYGWGVQINPPSGGPHHAYYNGENDTATLNQFTTIRVGYGVLPLPTIACTANFTPSVSETKVTGLILAATPSLTPTFSESPSPPVYINHFHDGQSYSATTFRSDPLRAEAYSVTGYSDFGALNPINNGTRPSFYGGVAIGDDLWFLANDADTPITKMNVVTGLTSTYAWPRTTTNPSPLTCG